jgi:hypothetical protein
LSFTRRSPSGKIIVSIGETCIRSASAIFAASRGFEEPENNFMKLL